MNTFIMFIPTSFYININDSNKKKINSIYICSEFIYIYFFTKFFGIFFCKISNIILISTNLLNPNFNKHLSELLKTTYNYFTGKIKFNGKSYRVEKILLHKQSIFNFTFGHALDSFVGVNNVKKKQLKKTKLYFWYVNKNVTKVIFDKITKLRFFNSFTQRGLRKNKQIIFKRQGKKSTYV